MRRLVATLTRPVAVHAQIARTDRATVVLAPDETPMPTDLDLGPVDFVSGGAITNASLNVLVRARGLRCDARVIDGDVLAIGNANRYAFFRRSCLGLRKAADLANWSTSAFHITPVPLRLELRTLSAILPLAPRVVLGVDDIPSRWLAQRHAPGWVGVGATVHFTAVVSDHTPETPCAGCLHPRDDGIQADIPTVSFVSYWAGLLVATRLILGGLGVRSSPETQALELCPLRLDRPAGQWWHRVEERADCPVQRAA
jgi:hypothetical protein